MSDKISLVNDPTIEEIEFIVAKPIVQRLDVWPFVLLYSLVLGAYFNTIEEAHTIFAMIAILLVFALHLVVILLGYWRINFRVAIAYKVLSGKDVLRAFSSFNAAAFKSGVATAQDQYEGQLSRYKMWHGVWQKTNGARYTAWQAQTAQYQRNPQPNSIPPGPWQPSEPPQVPVLGSPAVVYGGDILEVVIRPTKHHGEPTICQCVFDAGDATRIQYRIEGLLTPEEVLKGANSIFSRTSKILLSGQQYFPPIKFSFHHMQYTIDPSKPENINKNNNNTGVIGEAIPQGDNRAQFMPRQYPESLPLQDYLTHKLTPLTTVTPLTNSNPIVGDNDDDDQDDEKEKTEKKKQVIDNNNNTPTTSAYAAFRMLQYGLNSLSVPIPSFISIFIENAMSPFFVFQIVCILLWMLDEYWYYSLFTLFMIVVLECTVVYKRQSHLQQMLGEKPPLPHVYVYRCYDDKDPQQQQQIQVLLNDYEKAVAKRQRKQARRVKKGKTQRELSPLQSIDRIASKNKNTPNAHGEWVLTPSKCLVPGDIVALPIYNDREQINVVFGPKNNNFDIVKKDENDDDENDDDNDDDEEEYDYENFKFAKKVPAEYRQYNTGRPQLFTTDIPCDLLLLSGSCVCDESMLTGESVPQIKEDLISLNTYSNDDNNDNDKKQNNNDEEENDLLMPLNNNNHKRHILYSGTKLIGIQRSYDFSAFNNNNNKTSTTTTTNEDETPYSNLLATRPPLLTNTDIILTRVLRTGFSTTQGSLIRTILTAANNVLIDKEALYFILALLCCAIVSAYHVLMQGLQDPTRSKYKLLLNVITILTSVVPPELPMQLSMAVNNALALLAKTKVFCTEPNRIPLAGELNVCCFDKTGTLCNDTFLLTCAVTKDNNNNNNNDGNKNKKDYIVMRSTITSDDIQQLEQQQQDNNDAGIKSLSAHHLPIDMRLIMGCANELTMLQLPQKKRPQQQQQTNEDGTPVKQQPTQRIIGDPMESVAFTQAGFNFFTAKKTTTTNNKNKYVEDDDVLDNNKNDNTNNKMWCDAAPVIFNEQDSTYNTPKTLSIASSNNNTNASIKTRIETETIHRFTFQSQLQRMSSIIHMNLPQHTIKANPTNLSQQVTNVDFFKDTKNNNASIEWLNTTLPAENNLRQLGGKTMLRCVVKGSPEAIYNLLHPDYRPDFATYTEQHKSLARQGIRVLALAWKPLFIDTTLPQHHVLTDVDAMALNLTGNIKGSIDYQQKFVNNSNTNTWLQQLKIPTRDFCEKNLFFGGIIGFNSPLKTQSLEVIQHLQQALHKTICITGDHLLTAIAVAKSLKIANQEKCLLLSIQDKDAFMLANNTATNPSSPTTPNPSVEAPKFIWLNEREEYVKDFKPDDQMFFDLFSANNNITIQQTKLHTMESLCINGDMFKLLTQYHPECLPLLCSVTSVFARTLPYQKELILKFIKEYKSQKVSFVGDGTNDIGGLSHAHIGIALLPIDTDSQEQVTAQELKLKEMMKNPLVKKLLENAQKLREKGFTAQAETIEQQAHTMHKRLQTSQLGGLMAGMDEDEEDDGSVKLGDASLAAAFSAKHGSIRCILDVVRQGRCALATTGQMYQILALQCLTAAYSLSALYFQGVRQSESQMTVGGLVGAAMAMLMSYSQPLEKVSPRRPNSKIFSMYNITTILVQFAIHLSILMYMVGESMEYTSVESLKLGQDETITTYTPSVLNTVVFTLSTAMGATTILSNYVGYPFMTPLTWTPLFKVILGTLAGCVALSLETFPDINTMLEMSPMPTPDFGFNLANAIVLDCVGCVVVSLVTKLYFGIVTWDDLVKPIPKDVLSKATSGTPATAASTDAAPAAAAPALTNNVPQVTNKKAKKSD